MPRVTYLGWKHGGGSSQPSDFAPGTYLEVPVSLSLKMRLIKLTSEGNVDETIQRK